MPRHERLAPVDNGRRRRRSAGMRAGRDMDDRYLEHPETQASSLTDARDHHARAGRGDLHRIGTVEGDPASTDPAHLTGGEGAVESALTEPGVAKKPDTSDAAGLGDSIPNSTLHQPTLRAAR